MDNNANRRQPARFGLYEVDLSAGKLYKGGRLVPLQEKPYRILHLLLERPGELVTREDLRRKLWAAGTVVEFDEGLNTAIGKLRHALGDSAECPVLIETVRGKGYRFIAPVLNNGGGTSALAEGTTSREGRHGDAPNPAPATPAQSWPRRAAIPAMLCLAVVAALTAAYSYWPTRATTPKFAEGDELLVVDFANSTGDPTFDDTLREALLTELQQSPFLSLVSDQMIRETLGLMKHSPKERVNGALAYDLCQRIGVKAMVFGSVGALGAQYVIGLNAVNCQTGDSLVRAEVQAARKEEVLKALDKAAIHLRSKLGESLASLQRFDTPVERATTSSLEALKAYSVGRRLLNEDNATPIPWLQQAIRLDATFALAYSNLASAYMNLGEWDLAADNSKAAYDLSHDVSQRERFYIESSYHEIVDRNYQKARQVYELAAEIYPRDWHTWHNRGWYCMYFGQHEMALGLFRKAEELSHMNAMTVTALLMGELNLNRLAEARATAESAESKGVKAAAAPMLYMLAFLQNDVDEMSQELGVAINSPGYTDLMLSMQSDTEAYYGRMVRARDFSRQAVMSARVVNRNESAANWQANAAWREAEFGNRALAQREANDALTLSTGIDVKTLAAMSFARSGDFIRARTLLGDLAQRPDDSLLTCYWIPTIEAAIELGLRKPTRTIALLEAAAPCELGTTAPTYWIAAAAPVYLRGEAYLALHQPKQAAAEFQKIIDHRGAVKNSPFGAFAVLQLARAKALAGERAGALEAYHGFLALWKDADANIRPLRDARAELARLE